MNTRTITKIIAILLLAMCSMPAFSQLRFGVRADVGLNNPTFGPATFEVENLTSFSIGPTLELMIPVVNFGVETALLYSNSRMNVTSRWTPLPGSYPDPGFALLGEIRNHYLLLPVNAKKKFGLGILPMQLFATAGPYIGYLISSNRVEVEAIDESVRSFKAGIGLGFGVEVLRRLQVGVQYRLQLTDNYDVNKSVWGNVINPLNEKTSSWNLSATFFF